MWRVDPDPLLEFGSDFDGGTERFQDVRGLAFNGSGELVVVDAGVGLLIRIDRMGRQVREERLAGNGSPGLLRPRLLGVLRDGSAVLWDDATAKLLVGRRTASLSQVDAPGLVRDPPPIPWGVFPDGQLLASLPSPRFGWPVDGMAETDTLSLWRIDPGSGDSTLVVQRPGRSWLMEGGRRWPVPFTLTPPVATYRGGVVVTGGPEAEVDFLTLDGSLRLRSILGYPKRQVTEEDMDRSEAFLLRGATSEQEKEAVRLHLGSMPVPPYLPFFDQIVISREGEVWLRHTLVDPLSESLWSVLDPRGHLLGEIALPRRFQLFDVSGDRLVGIGWNALLIETIRVHRVQRGAG